MGSYQTTAAAKARSPEEPAMPHHPGTRSCALSVEIPVGWERVAADLTVPDTPAGLVIFAHGSGSSRYSPRNQAVARTLQARGLATLLSDLLTPGEKILDQIHAHLRFDVDRLGRRLVTIIDWARKRADVGRLPIGLFGASTGAAAALVAAAARPNHVRAIVSRGGRPDLAGAALPQVTAPTLLLVGGVDADVIELNRWTKVRMRCPVTLEIVPGATHLFEEPGTLEQVASHACGWFSRHLPLVQAEQRQMAVHGPQH